MTACRTVLFRIAASPAGPMSRALCLLDSLEKIQFQVASESKSMKVLEGVMHCIAMRICSSTTCAMKRTSPFQLRSSSVSPADRYIWVQQKTRGKKERGNEGLFFFSDRRHMFCMQTLN